MLAIPSSVKPIFPPTVTLGISIVFQFALQKWGQDVPSWWLYMLIGATTFWLLISLAKNPALTKRYPGLVDYFPFLSVDHGKFTRGSELTKTHVQGHTFRISELAIEGLLENRTFEDCDIHGPGVILWQGGSWGMYDSCQFMGDPKLMLIYPREGQIGALGTIAVPGCVFRRCRFWGIGITGPAAALDSFLRNVPEYIDDGMYPTPNEPQAPQGPSSPPSRVEIKSPSQNAQVVPLTEDNTAGSSGY